MRARGFSTPRTSAHIGTALSVALAGLSIGLATPAYAAPEGPDNAVQGDRDQPVSTGVVVFERPGTVSLNRSKVFGVPPGLQPQGLHSSLILLGIG
ncbi:hypothetical protein [Mycolicibacterium sp. P9-22]|uniref:hypothetical protein n=1 Tax=Mycolicibacterium sp. P9-22 TaxID=2024613 RepID=UPI0011F09BC6|nr:hypothetical protein [Mycolicibacterium sp. P9-22]KAA0111556.1 hypothetical protein CIW51_28340 [Mycolicibacterium sp. P9-22]